MTDEELDQIIYDEIWREYDEIWREADRIADDASAVPNIR